MPRCGPAEAIAKLPKGEPVDPAEIYFRCVPTVDVSDPALAWLTGSVLIGISARGRIARKSRFIGWGELLPSVAR